MNGKTLIITLLLILLLLSIIFNNSKDSDEPVDTQINIMKITSPAFKHNENIPSKYTCDGENINPTLNISDVPEGTQGLVLINDDPDAPAGTWVHWILWNISPDVKEITENSVPAGAVEGMTSFGNAGYGGPCPPSGTHRYFFKLYAIDTLFNLSTSTDKDALEKSLEGHILDQAELVGLYSRK